MATAEVHEITLKALEDLADAMLLGYYMPGVGDYVMVMCDCWLDHVQQPLWIGTCSTLEDAKQELEFSYSHNMGSIAQDFEIWHVVPDGDLHALTHVDRATDQILYEEIFSSYGELLDRVYCTGDMVDITGKQKLPAFYRGYDLMITYYYTYD